MMPNYTLKQLAYFIAAADSGTTSQAAAEFYISQSALSSALTELETALGVQLLKRRKGRGVTLTEAGRSVLAQARALLNSAEDFAVTASDLSSEVSGTLTIGCFEMLAPAVLPRLMAGFKEKWPAVTMDFVEGDQHLITEALTTGQVEIAFQFRSATRDTELVTHVMSVPTPHVILSENHHLADAQTIMLHELENDPLILMSSDAGESFIRQCFALADVTPNIAFRSGSFDHIRSLVVHGLGYSLVVQRPRKEPRTNYPGMVSIPLGDPLPADPILIVRRKDTQLTRRAQAFWKYACEHSAAAIQHN